MSIAQPSLGQRLQAHRVALGLTRADVAARAGVDADYIEYLEQQNGTPSAAVLRRLALAVGASVEEVAGEQWDVGAHAPPRLQVLTQDECWVMLRSRTAGRVGFTTGGSAPVILPVNYAVLGRSIVVVTRERAHLGYVAREGRIVSFEVDEIDEHNHSGWSVLAHGPTRMAEPGEAERIRSLGLVEPWAGGDRTAVVAVNVQSISGRRVVRRPEPLAPD